MTERNSASLTVFTFGAQMVSGHFKFAVSLSHFDSLCYQKVSRDTVSMKPAVQMQVRNEFAYEKPDVATGRRIRVTTQSGRTTSRTQASATLLRLIDPASPKAIATDTAE